MILGACLRHGSGTRSLREDYDGREEVSGSPLPIDGRRMLEDRIRASLQESMRQARPDGRTHTVTYIGNDRDDSDRRRRDDCVGAIIDLSSEREILHRYSVSW